MGQPPGQTTPSQPHGLRSSFHDAMASLLNAIAPSRPTAQARGSRQAAPAAAHVVAEPIGGPTATAAVAPSAQYDIADALADVAEAIAPRAVAARSVAALEVVAAQNAIVAPKALVAPKAVARPVVKPVVVARTDWQPTSTAPLDRNVQIGVTSKNGILAIFFPCRRTEAGWINAIVKAPLLHDPIFWREWHEDYFEAT